MPVITYNSTYNTTTTSTPFRTSSLLSGSNSSSSSQKYLDNLRYYPTSSSASSASISSNTSASSTFSSSSSSSSLSSASSSTSTYSGLSGNNLSNGIRSLVRPTSRGFNAGNSITATPRSSISSYNSLHNSPSPTYIYPSPLSGLSSTSNVTLTGYQRRSSLVNEPEPKQYYGSASSLKQIPNYLAGLYNLGNTCYMNSVLQALYATQLFKKFVTRNPKGALLSALGKLYEDMSEPENNVIYPSTFRNQFIKYQPKFRGYDQQDAQEFLRYLINGIHEEVNQAKYSTRPKNLKSPRSSSEAWEQYKYIDDSPLIDLVAGQLGSTIRCTVCNNSSTCYDPFWDLSLPLPSNLRECDVLRCLDEFTALEHMEAGELVSCDRCNRQRRCTKELSIVKMPTVLILHLKRFSNEGYKLSHPRISPNEQLKIGNRTFQLYSIVCHHGSSSRSGHYTSYCAHNGKWYHFNDDKITEESNFRPSNCEDAYILFYIDKERNPSTTYTSRL